MMNKKGDLENLFGMIMLFGLAASIFVGYFVLDAAHPAFADTPDANSLVGNAETMLSRLGGIGFIFILTAVILTNVIGAYFLLTSPIFLVIDIILFPISIWICSILSNSYESSIGTFSIMTTALPGINFVMLNLPYIIVGIDVLVAIAKYALVKTRG